MKETATQKIARQNGWTLLGSKGSNFVSSVIIRPYVLTTK